MRYLKYLLFIASVTYASAQTNSPSLSSGLQQIVDSFGTATNWATVTGYGHSTKGNKNLAFVDLAYNFSQSVGVVIGYDYLWDNQAKTSQANLVKGGINLQAPIKPLKQFGFENLTVTPFGFVLMSSGNGNVSEIVGGGGKVKLWEFHGYGLNTGLIYENRIGAQEWSGRYLGGFLSVSKGF